MPKFLYGASVQGIQDFIFQTNKLKEIIGASNLVELICTDFFEQALESLGADVTTSGELIMRAAGNIKYIFNEEAVCREFFRIFPRIVRREAPGVTFSQAVVRLDGDAAKDQRAFNELERRLRAQRNKPARSASLGLMGIKRSRDTGLPCVAVDGNELPKGYDNVDAGTLQKLKYYELRELCNKAFGDLPKASEIAYDTEDLTGDNNWIAIIHADGNGLGRVVSTFGGNTVAFRNFSESLNEATKDAVQSAFQETMKNVESYKRIPFRPVVLGGDDLTMICRGDLAIKFTASYLKHFEENTLHVCENGLTACAGIAFIKASYPFYYGYNLAEELCTAAKKDSGREQSCLMFHKIQDCFAEDYDSIKARELTPQENLSFSFGPYYLQAREGRWTVNELLKHVGRLLQEEFNPVKNGLRQWLASLHDDPEMAEQRLRRMMSLASGISQQELVALADSPSERESERKKVQCYPAFDVLSCISINQSIRKTYGD